MELYYEDGAKMRDKKKAKIRLTVIAVISAAIFLSSFMFLFFSFQKTGEGSYSVELLPRILSALLIALSVFVWIKKDEVVYDYDYILVNGEIKIVKVINEKRRRLKYDIKPSQISKVGRYDSESFKRLAANPKIKPAAATPNKNYDDPDSLYYIAFSGKDKTEIVILECKYEFIYNLMKFLNKSVLESEFK